MRRREWRRGGTDLLGSLNDDLEVELDVLELGVGLSILARHDAVGDLPEDDAHGVDVGGSSEDSAVVHLEGG